MKFYEKYYPGGYEELLTYYPRFYRDVFEMTEILKAHGRLADGMEGNIERTYRNGFIDYADEAAIGKLERFLGAAPGGSRTLEERRRLVKSYFVGAGKLSASKLNEIIRTSMETEADIELARGDEEGNHWLFLRFDSGSDETLHFGDLRTILDKKLPANLKYRLNVQYDTDIRISDIERAEFTHMDVQAFFYYFKRILNGGWPLDGSVSLGQIPICETAMGIVMGTVSAVWKGKASVPALYINAAFPAAVAGSRCGMENGLRMDASKALDAEMKDVGVNIPLRLEAGVETKYVTVEKDLWRLAGEVLMDGSRMLDAETWEEDL